MPRPRFTPGNAPMLSIGQEAGCATEQVWTQQLEEESICLCWGTNPDLPVIQFVVRHCS
jgi:hypothetical protein